MFFFVVFFFLRFFVVLFFLRFFGSFLFSSAYILNFLIRNAEYRSSQVHSSIGVSGLSSAGLVFGGSGIFIFSGLCFSAVALAQVLSPVVSCPCPSRSFYARFHCDVFDEVPVSVKQSVV